MRALVLSINFLFTRIKLSARILILLLSVSFFPLWSAEGTEDESGSSDSFSEFTDYFDGKISLRSERIVSPDSTYYPLGPSLLLNFWYFDKFTPYFSARYLWNRAVFDGLGNLDFISAGDARIGTDYDLADSVSLDVYYKRGFGESSYVVDEGFLGIDVTAGKHLDISAGATYASTSYIYPGSTINVSNEMLNFEAGITFRLNDKISFPVAAERTQYTYTTSNPYSMNELRGGVDIDFNKKFSVDTAATIGTDSNKYTLLGAEISARYRHNMYLGFSVWADYISYSKPAQSTTSLKKGKQLSSGSTSGSSNPLGAGDEFSYTTIGIEATYYFGEDDDKDSAD